MKAPVSNIAALALTTAAVLFAPIHSIAQTSDSQKAVTWQDLGYNQLPPGFSTELLPLFEGLSQARGTWNFVGELAGDDGVKTLQGSLKIGGNPKSGMFPFWQMVWGWPTENPEYAVIYNVMAGPRKDGFDLMLIQMGPMKNPEVEKVKPKLQPTSFEGKWDLQNRKITWTERAMGVATRGESVEVDSSKPKQTFEMTVATDGKIEVGNFKNASLGQMTSGNATVRTADAPAEPVVLTGEHRFDTVAEVLDRRIKPWLPPQATEILLLSERNGHFARYKVDESHFIRFLDELWEADNGKSAHKRSEMDEGELSSPERIMRRMKVAGNEALGNFRIYHSPSKASAAMTIYYYDRKTGIAYHDRGYW